jgi:hypothetical protein
MSDWTRSETIAAPDVIVVKYKNELPNGNEEPKEQVLISTTRSLSVTTYTKIPYNNADGTPQIAEVADKKVDTKTTTIASVNQAYIAFRLAKSQGLPSGNAKSENITISEYKITVNGPVLVKETILNYDSLAQFAGGLQVQDYSSFQPSGSEMILTQRTERVITLLTSPEGRDVTKTETSRWMARGVTQQGATDFAIMYDAFKSFIEDDPSIVDNLVRAFVDLVFEGTEVQIETGRIPVPIKPPDQEIIADEISNYGDSSERDRSSSGSLSFGDDDPDTIVRAEYPMPFAPDDFFRFEDGERVLVPGNAEQAADCFGRTEAALDVGHAFGQNIVTGWNEIPTLDLTPIYVRQAGIEGAFLMDSTSYAWGPDGLVVSSDLMLLGASGWYGATQPTTSWLQLPVAVAGLQQVSAGTTGTASKANSSVIPSGFSARNPGPVLATLPNNGTDSYALFRTLQQVVGPTLELERNQLGTGPSVRVAEFEYPLILPLETFSLATGPLAELDEFAPVNVPAAAVVVAGVVPVVATTAVVQPPAAVVVVAGVAPEVVAE